MAENKHAISFTAFKKYCKYAHENGYNCMNGANRILGESICYKNYCPLFADANVVVQSKTYDNGAKVWQDTKRRNTMGVSCGRCGKRAVIFHNWSKSGGERVCESCVALDRAEARAPMNATCEKCGRRYCDHENKY